MIDRARARELAERYLEDLTAKGAVPLVLLDEHTREEDFGWVFFYNSRAFVETGKLTSALAGNGPIAIDRATGELTELGTASPIEDEIRDYARRARG